MICRDYLGWPLEYIKGRPITNFIRMLLHTNIKQTWKLRHKKDDFEARPIPNCDSSPNVGERPIYDSEIRAKWNV